jgi:F0F1-type ATP synthase membrane subunit c/vacuolar-type H+-ATPase subunit K
MANEDVIANLIVKLSAQTTEVAAGLKKAESEVASFAGKVKGIFLALASAGAAFGLGSLVKSVIDATAELSRLAEKVGVPIESLITEGNWPGARPIT